MEGAMQADKIPAEIWEAARSLRNAVLWESNSSVEHIARALMARDTAARKECAEIARQKYIARVDDDGKMAFAAGSEIATAIEATITGGGDG
jgi:hypothetical protein